MDVSFCEQTANIWKVLGDVLNIIRIVIPIIIILLGMLDLGKIVISGDSKAMKESQKMFIKRLIYGIAIFFVGTVVKLAFSLVGDNITEGDWKICWICVARPDDKECVKYAGKLIEDNSVSSDVNDNHDSSTEYVEEGGYETSSDLSDDISDIDDEINDTTDSTENE